jgi:hypothetical protein
VLGISWVAEQLLASHEGLKSHGVSYYNTLILIIKYWIIYIKSYTYYLQNARTRSSGTLPKIPPWRDTYKSVPFHTYLYSMPKLRLQLTWNTFFDINRCHTFNPLHSKATQTHARPTTHKPLLANFNFTLNVHVFMCVYASSFSGRGKPIANDVAPPAPIRAL